MYVLTVDIIDKEDGIIYVSHVFYGETEEGCRENMQAHASHCDQFKAAIRDGRTDEELEEMDDDEWPEAEQEELEIED